MPPPQSARPSLELDFEDETLSPTDALPPAEPAAAKPDVATPTSTEAAIAAIDRMPSHLAELAKRALVQGDLDTLERLIEQLRQTGEHSDLAERMSSFVALGRGAKAEALRKLQAASEVEMPPGQRARALLAYGVALAATGHHEGALLEALSALARARETGDAYGEEACARFLARLSSATGHSNAAVAWASVVKRVSPASRG